MCILCKNISYDIRFIKIPKQWVQLISMTQMLCKLSWGKCFTNSEFICIYQSFYYSQLLLILYILFWTIPIAPIWIMRSYMHTCTYAMFTIKHIITVVRKIKYSRLILILLYTHICIHTHTRICIHVHIHTCTNICCPTTHIEIIDYFNYSNAIRLLRILNFQLSYKYIWLLSTRLQQGKCTHI